MVKFDFTPEQKIAIENRGGALLCSAAAGSGKTRVLVERLIERVTDESDPCDIDDFLVITYTKAAAAELRSRILDGIYARIAEDPENRRLRRQAEGCYRAQIGTIHSFCARLLREMVQALGISPDFRVADESESDIMKTRVMENVLEERYRDMSEGFALLVDTMGAGRDDSKLVVTALDTHTKLQSHPYPEKWVKEQLAELRLDGVTDVSQTVWGGILMQRAESSARYWQEKLYKILEGGGDYPDFMAAYGESLTVTLSCVRAFLSGLRNSWDEAAINSVIAFPRAKPLRGCDDLKEMRTRCKKELDKVTGPFRRMSEGYFADMRAVAPAVEELLFLVLDFDAAYSAEKRRRSVIDFSDQEHMAVRLLIDPETGEPTETAREVSSRYREIMVDEYQDVNAVQELIFHAVSKDGENIFMVGDVRQSIYRFRLADPTIFLQKYRSFKDAAEAEPCEGRKVLLSQNFRSREGILSAVNFIFKNIMSPDFGELDYTEREFLRVGAAYPEKTEPSVELDVIDMAGTEDEDGESPEKAGAEAAFIARRVLELKRTLLVSDGKGGERPASFGDMAILLRSVAGKAPEYASALRRAGIPVSSDRSGPFFEAPEIIMMLSLLSVIDNPHQDIPLISVLRSPIWGFNADELALIRLSDRKSDLYSALRVAAESDEKCRAFAEELSYYRNLAPDMSADRFLWHIYNRTGIFAIVGAMRGGTARRKNLMLLFEYAQRFESAGYKGLFGFISYMRELRERGDDPGETVSADDDAVRIMSIHKSKGLEFPVVFLADTAKKFNTMDAKKPLLIHPKLGIGAKRLDLVRRIEYPTLPRLAVAEAVNSENMAEEMRVLYVAMTRAREKLVITAAYSDAEREMAKLLKDSSLPVPPQVLAGTHSMADWILLPALSRPESGDLRFSSPFLPCEDEKDRWEVRLIKSAELTEAADDREARAPESAKGEGIDPAAVRALTEKLEFEYPYAAAVDIPSKLTATELKGRFPDFEAAEDAETIPKDKKRRELRTPDFSGPDRPITAAERGVALHLVMQYADYSKCAQPGGAAAEAERLRALGVLSEKQARAVRYDMIEAFFASDIGRRVLSAENLKREFKFSLLVPASEFFPDGGDDRILLQGVVDCWFEENGGITVLDFKTDYVTEESAEERAGLYAGQLSAYATALSRITGKPVREKLLYFFAINRAIAL